MRTIAFRADASVPLGSGHVKRCLSLARAAGAAGLQPLFVCREGDGTARGLLADAGIEVLWLPPAADDAMASASLLQGREIAWVVVDHYGLDAAWHVAVRERLHCRIAAIDDLADRALAVDLLLDGNDEDAAHNYAARLQRRARVLGGPEYSLLDPAYADAPRYAFHHPVRSIGIFMGGTDPTGACLDALGACIDAGFGGEVEVVCSPSSPRFGDLALACHARPGTRLVEGLPRLDGFYARHDLLLGAGGTASWERCCIGTPTIACMTADNQRATLPRLEQRGALRWARDEGRGLRAAMAQALLELLADAGQRRALGEAARMLVDGRGSARVAAVLACAAGAPQRVRPATAADEALTLRWANEPAVRAGAFQSDPVLPEGHAQWLRARLANPQRRLFLAEAPNGVPVGQVRLEQAGDGWEIGYLLAPAFRGLGLGAPLLRAALAAAPGALPLLARVKPGNEASLRVFRRLGFQEQAVQDARGPHRLFRLDGALAAAPATIPHADR
jgi:UDP-2,4-diacetamido-2,4,6-trideoxy-beta-L-altropyranose hydrolase